MRNYTGYADLALYFEKFEVFAEVKIECNQKTTNSMFVFYYKLRMTQSTLYGRWTIVLSLSVCVNT